MYPEEHPSKEILTLGTISVVLVVIFLGIAFHIEVRGVNNFTMRVLSWLSSTAAGIYLGRWTKAMTKKEKKDRELEKAKEASVIIAEIVEELDNFSGDYDSKKFMGAANMAHRSVGIIKERISDVGGELLKLGVNNAREKIVNAVEERQKMREAAVNVSQDVSKGALKGNWRVSMIFEKGVTGYIEGDVMSDDKEGNMEEGEKMED